MRVRFLADADLNKTIVNGVVRREPSLDFLTAHSAGLRGMNDIGTMPSHFRAFGNTGNRSSGVFLVPQSLDVRTAIEELLLIWLVSEASEWEDRLTWLPL